jgi:hypothetical protein
MKNMLKNKTSLIIVCVFIGILICHFTMCGCKSNYGLIEGLTTNVPGAPSAAGAAPPPKMKPTAGASSGGAPTPAPAAAPAPASAAALSPSSTLASGPANSTAPNQLGDLMETAKAMMGAPSTGSMATGAAVAPAASVGKESFEQQGRPLGYGSLQESKNDDWNFSKWVKDAMRYAKGMGNENRLDSYQYNSGPPIPLPEGEMFFFKDTKFSTQCCPGTYSNSLGCACLSQLQFNYLMTRGGNNNVPTGCKTAYYNEY